MTDPLFVDVYAGDGPKDWDIFCKAGPPWHGVIIKCSQGTYYRPAEYARERWRFFAAANDRYGIDLFEGAYHYLDLSIDGSAQADYAMAAVEDSGGEKSGTLWMTVDIERGGQRKIPSRQGVIDCVSRFAERYHQLSGRPPTLYGGELLRALNVGDLMGCGRSWVALYGSELHGKGESTAQFLVRTGTDLAHLMLWQYDAGNDEKSPEPKGYPNEAPGCGKVDISALVMSGGISALRSMLWAEKP